MLKVLIADDEKKVCKLIFHLIDWEAMGLEVVGIVNNGRAAYEFICAHGPDIVITDIKMPNFDGMELIRRAKEQFPNIFFIIISGYSNFEYAQHAIKYGVEDYLLKPLKKKELQSTLSKIIEKHQEILDVASEKEKLQTLFHSAEEKVRKNLVNEMLMNPDRTEASFQRETINQEFHCHFVEGYYTVLKIHPFLSTEEVIDEAPFTLLLSKIEQIVKEKLEPCCEELVTSIYENTVICILNTQSSSMSEIKKQLNRMKNDIMNLKDIFRKINVVMGLGGVAEEMKGLFRSITEADLAIMNRVAEPGKYVIQYHENKRAEGKVSDLVDGKCRSDLLGYIERLDIDGALQKIQVVEKDAERYASDGKLIYDCYMELVDIFLFGIKNYKFEVNPPDEQWFKRKYNTYMTLQDIFKGLEDEIYKILHAYAENIKNADNKPIRLAKQFINEKYNETLSLESVSAHVGFNPAYFSSLFKKETGKNFTEYVTEVRIQHAKQFLIRTDKELADIAMEVGYMDYKYFSKLFKKITGLNPSEYRKLYN